ncbi:putative nucleic acid-binding protein [Rosa chinensis]|uniref:Putative nucleic acid-binding protein n=1 Tax=Rosa chinensis TaxID=74649 RepID=A0A2P6Q358_ROSCH|nr:putative nucleic acid-binding protein [Rosa chinensis]
MQNQLVYCKASIRTFSTHEGWWYEACPQCYKQLTVKKNSDLRICQEHGMQIPLPCYRLHVTIEDPNSEATVKLRGKPAEQLFGITCKELLNKCPYAPQETLPPEILQTRADPCFSNPNH